MKLHETFTAHTVIILQDICIEMLSKSTFAIDKSVFGASLTFLLLVLLSIGAWKEVFFSL
jgi:hypothetical protein